MFPPVPLMIPVVTGQDHCVLVALINLSCHFSYSFLTVKAGEADVMQRK